MSFPSIRLESLEIINYKAIDHLSLSFETNVQNNGVDAFVIGSENGIGKTSLLECITWLVGLGIFQPDGLESAINGVPMDEYIRSGEDKFQLKGGFTGLVLGDNNQINSSQEITMEYSRGQQKIRTERSDSFKPQLYHGIFPINITEITTEPINMPGFLFLPSIRRLKEGGVHGSMLSGGDNISSYEQVQSLNDIQLDNTKKGITLRQTILKPYSTFSLFKQTVLKHLMITKDMLDGNVEKSQETLDLLNKLLNKYANVKFGKLKLLQSDFYEMQVSNIEKTDKSFALDFLSSGQKEIVTTLFLIWYLSHETPSLVLIDEPELHLNRKWQVDFIKQLYEIAPKNQYIIASHSSAIMEGVPKERRILLLDD